MGRDALQGGTVLVTDRAWPDDRVEREIIESAGYGFVSGPSEVLPASEIDALAKEHRPVAIMACWAKVSEAAIAASPDLRLVQRIGVGLDNIAVEFASERGVPVANVPDFCVEEVSDHAIGMALNWTRGLSSSDREVRSGRWDPSSLRLRRLSSLTCGVVGYGRIGRLTTRKLEALGARVLVSTPRPPADGTGAEIVSFNELLALSEVVILTAPSTPETYHLIGAPEFAQMRAGSMLINVSRGALVDTVALIAALECGHLGGAGLDVLEDEPTVPPELLEFPSVTVTPHSAFSSDVAVDELRRRSAEEVVRVLAGGPPLNLCNQPAVLPAPGAEV